MKKLSFVVSLVLAFALSVWAQTPSTNDTQSGAGSSASQGSQPSAGSQGSMTSPSTSSQTAGSQGNMGTAEQGKAGKEQKLKGCLESENGSYVLREKSGKEIALTGSADLSQYANHEVAVHGDWASGAGSSASTSGSSASSSTSDMSKSSGSEKQFTVDKVDSISDTCKGAKKAEKDKGAGINTNPSGPQ